MEKIYLVLKGMLYWRGNLQNGNMRSFFLFIFSLVYWKFNFFQLSLGLRDLYIFSFQICFYIIYDF